MKKRTRILAFLVALLFTGVGCGNNVDNGGNSAQDTSLVEEIETEEAVPPPIRELPANEEGLIEVVIPPNLFGGDDVTAEEFAGKFKEDQRMTSVAPNDNGTATMAFTPEQYKTYREEYYIYAQFPKYFAVDSIKEIVYENELLTEITVLVDSALYEANGFERQMCNSLLAIEAGMYQVLSGVAPEEWHTTISVKDIDTVEIVSVNEFPNDDMYRAY